MTASLWPAQLRAAGVARVAVAGRLTFRGRDFGPCPCCKAVRRSERDRCRPLWLAPTDRGWRCIACGNRGGPLELAAAIVTGTTRPRSLVEVAIWCAARGLVERPEVQESQRYADGDRHAA